MKYVKYLFVILLSSSFLYSCSSDDEELMNDNIGAPVAVQFTSTVDGVAINPMSRAVNSTWTAGDKVGLFMKKAGVELSATSIVGNASNIEYVTATNNGVFSVVNPSEMILYPKGGDQVDFVAYYPYLASATNYKYAVDVADQSNQEAIDLMYADNVKAASSSNPEAKLNFTHLLTNLTFTITAGAGVTDLSGLKVTIADLPTAAELALKDATLTIDNSSVKTVSAKVATDGKSVEAIVLPAGIKTFNVTFELGTNSFTTKIENLDLTKGLKKNFNVTIKNTGGSVTPTPPKPLYAAWTETPTFEAKTGIEYINHIMPNTYSLGKWSGQRNYSMLYDKANRVALWIAYPLHSSHMGSVGRSDWMYDPSSLIPNLAQPDVVRNTWPSFSDPNKNYNRGHQIASSDRTGTAALNQMTFYVTNATLQNENFNGGIWNHLENKVQNMATSSSDTIYVVTGVMLETKANPGINYEMDNANRQCAVPKYFYKVIGERTASGFTTIGYKMENVAYPKGTNFENYKVEVSQLEEETGYKFFSGAK